ncbi:MAG: ImmA/IrrE family metallo-endopeptidase, partial [Clostridium saudiense]|nr:ImmA/IrrE family metallo-endopeptidase [Clostridium saudiense]
HELGHIICGHFELEEDLIHLPDYKHEILEKEANAFASELLAPTSLLQIHIGAGNITSWHGVKENFSVSCQEAQILFNRVYYPSNKEIALYRCDEILTSLIFMQKNTLAPTRVSSNRKA